MQTNKRICRIRSPNQEQEPLRENDFDLRNFRKECVYKSVVIPGKYFMYQLETTQSHVQQLRLFGKKLVLQWIHVGTHLIFCCLFWIYLADLFHRRVHNLRCDTIVIPLTWLSLFSHAVKLSESFL